MFFPVSDTIVLEHPELEEVVRRWDAYLLECSDVPIAPDLAADILGLERSLIGRLVGLYEAHNVVERVRLPVCARDGEWLTPTGEGAFWCDVCETTYAPTEPHLVEVVQLSHGETPPDASPRQAYGQHYALLVGISRYRSLRPLARAAADARALRAVLTDPQVGGFATSRVRLLVDEQASKQAISDALESLARQVQPSDTVLVFFSGHGVRRQGGFEQGQFLCPFDAEMAMLATTAISTKQLAVALQAIPAAQMLLILDACHAGGLGHLPKPAAALAAGLSEASYRRLAGAQGRVVIASSRPEEFSWEPPSMETSLFTHYLLEALKGKGGSQKGAVGVLDLYTYLATHVPQHAHQHPVLHGDLDGNFPVLPLKARGLAEETDKR